MALDWIGAKDARFHGMVAGGGGSRSSGGGGRGRGGPTAAEIRAKFDLDELADAVEDQWYSALLTHAPDARGLARAYVDQVVANPQQKLDFNTFVEKRIENTSRYNGS